MHTELLQLFNELVTLTSGEEEIIKPSFKPHTLKKGNYFLKAGETNEYIGSIRKRLVRYFVHQNVIGTYSERTP